MQVAGTRKYYPEQKEAIEADVAKLLERGIIRPSSSPWAAACVTVRKKDGTLRLCQDYRLFNQALE